METIKAPRRRESKATLVNSPGEELASLDRRDARAGAAFAAFPGGRRGEKSSIDQSFLAKRPLSSQLKRRGSVRERARRAAGVGRKRHAIFITRLAVGREG